jgi:hypothetical protein
MVDWRWVPRGLDGITKTCQGTVSGCAIKIYETGTLYVDAVVNSFPMTDSIEIYVYCPSGDTALDNSPAREAILESLGKEWRNADPDDSVKANRREQAGWVYQDPSTGKSDVWMNPDQRGDACSSFLGNGPSPQTMQFITHVHPFAPHETLPLTNCDPAKAGKPYFPGPSYPDDSTLQRGIDSGQIPANAQGVVMDSTNIYRYDHDGNVTKTPRFNKKSGCRVL